jgi:hypothetical protein
MFWEDDVAGFFSDFGEPAILKDGTEIKAIFDNEYALAEPMGVGIESSHPMVAVKSSDVEETIHGDTLEIREVTYSIIGIHPDGTGITNLILSV